MPKLERIAFLAMALHGCGFMLAYELMETRPVPAGGLTAVAGAHLACVLLAAMTLPALIRVGWTGRSVICAVLFAAFATRLPGVEGWRDSIPFRVVMQMGQGTLAATSYWAFFSLTPREHWVRRYIVAWLAGTAGKELVLAVTGLVGGRMPDTLFIGVGVVFGLLLVSISACVLLGDFSSAQPPSEAADSGKRAFSALTANTVLVAAFLGLLSGWVGPFHTLWADTSAFAPRIAAPATLALVGWRLSRDFRAGFRETTALCAALCLAIATLSVMRSEAMPARGIPILAVSCQTVFYACMTLALARVTTDRRLFALATALPYSAMIFAGMVTYETKPLQALDFSVILLLCLAVFMAFYFYTRKIDFSPRSGDAESANPECQEPTARMSFEQVCDHFGFTPREREVAALLARNLTATDIARSMIISRDTANTHIRNLCEKTGANGRVGIVKLLSETRSDTASE